MAKGAGIAAKVGEDIDPVNVGLKATGKAVSAPPKLSDLTAGIRTGLGASADSQRIHSVIELGDGSKVVIEDGRFIPVGKHGDVVGNTPRQEAVADARATPEETPARQREPAGVSVASRTTGATPHTEVAPGRTGGTHAGGPETPWSGARSTGSGHDGAGSGGRGGGLDDLGRSAMRAARTRALLVSTRTPDAPASCVRDPILTGLVDRSRWTRSKRSRSTAPTTSPGTWITTTARTAPAGSWDVTTKAATPHRSSPGPRRICPGRLPRIANSTPRSIRLLSGARPEARTRNPTPMGEKAEDFREAAAEYHYIAENQPDFEKEPSSAPRVERRVRPGLDK